MQTFKTNTCDYLIIADMHLYKHFFNIETNPYFSCTEQHVLDALKHHKTLCNAIWNDCIVSYVQECFRHWHASTLKGAYGTVIFLGDSFDRAKITEEQTEIFTRLIDSMIAHTNIEVKILVGNHDTNSSRNMLQYSVLRFVHDKYMDTNKVNVYPELYVETYKNDVLVFAPYYLRKKFYSILTSIVPVTENKTVWFFSHNNVYLTDSFKQTRMYKMQDIKQFLRCKQLMIFNGHIHVTHYENVGTVVPGCGFYQLGSVGSTSFKETPVASGVVSYNIKTQDTHIYENRKLLSLSINNIAFVPELADILKQAKQHKALIWLKYPEGIDEIDDLLQMYHTTICGMQTVQDIKVYKAKQAMQQTASIDNLSQIKKIVKCK